MPTGRYLAAELNLGHMEGAIDEDASQAIVTIQSLTFHSSSPSTTAWLFFGSPPRTPAL